MQDPPSLSSSTLEIPVSEEPADCEQTTGTRRAPRLDSVGKRERPSLPIFPFPQEDRKEGMTAFVEKRKASFKDQ